MIKAIIFDSGGVIVDQQLFFEKLNSVFRPKDNKKFWHEINIEAIPLCKNLISEKVFWEKIAKLNNKNPKKISKNLWRQGYESLTKINRNVLQLIKKLKKKYKLGLVSNSISYHQRINKKRSIYNLFDVVVLSHKIGLTKDNKEIFIIAAKKLNVRPTQCIFIDDVKDFVNVAKSIGMSGIVFKNSNQLKSDLGKLLNYELI